jgi:rhodanese-related sulfurtransferase
MPAKAGSYLALLVAGVLLLLAGCDRSVTPASDPLAGSRNDEGYVDIDVEQLVSLLESRDVTLINVHVPYAGDLPQTDLSIPYDEIADHLDLLPGKDAPIVLYCRSGSMSTAAATQLAELGYTNVMELDGGMQAWVASGLELVGP